ncbi:MAG: hypothetical protein HY902_15855 [Deltaproteobacteria bacterium]|nr:hypothetical protein [Deltaproteobacteria bacterium]
MPVWRMVEAKPVVRATFGRKVAGEVLWMSRSTRFVAVEQYDDDPKMKHHEFHQSTHGSWVGGTPPTLHLYNVDLASDVTVDRFFGDPQGRWLTYRAQGQFHAVDGENGRSLLPAEARADVDDDGNSCLPPRGVVFGQADEMAWIDQARQQVVVRSLGTGVERRVQVGQRIWRFGLDASGSVWVRYLVDRDARGWPKMRTTCACKAGVMGRVSACGVYGWSGPAYATRWFDAAGQALDLPAMATPCDGFDGPKEITPTVSPFAPGVFLVTNFRDQKCFVDPQGREIRWPGGKKVGSLNSELGMVALYDDERRTLWWPATGRTVDLGARWVSAADACRVGPEYWLPVQEGEAHGRMRLRDGFVQVMRMASGAVQDVKVGFYEGRPNDRQPCIEWHRDGGRAIAFDLATGRAAAGPVPPPPADFDNFERAPDVVFDYPGLRYLALGPTDRPTPVATADGCYVRAPAGVFDRNVETGPWQVVCPEGAGGPRSRIDASDPRTEAEADCAWSATCRQRGVCAWDLARGCTVTDAGCAASTACALGGTCALGKNGYGQRVCVATRDEDCAKSMSCIRFGTCHAVKGECRAASDAECLASEGCRELGYCKLQGKSCSNSKAGCQASLACQEDGLCTSDGGSCVADCASSWECERRGKCADSREGCIPTKVEHCQRSADCWREKKSSLVDNQCLAAPPATQPPPKGPPKRK